MQSKKPTQRMTKKDQERMAAIPASDSAQKNKPPVQRSEKVTIIGYRSDGQGIARLADGRVIFIPGVIQGEVVLAVFFDKGERFLNGFAEDFIELSEDRLEAYDPSVIDLGKGDLQFLPVQKQHEVKISILRDQLTRVGKLDLSAVEILPVVGSREAWGYLAEKAFLIQRSIALKKSYDDSPDMDILYTLGGIPLLSSERASDSEIGCPIAVDAIHEVISQLRFETGHRLHGAVLRADRDNEIQMILIGESEKPEIELETDLAVSVVYQGSGGSYVMSGGSTMVQNVGGFEIAVPDTAPFYGNPGIYAPLFEMLSGLLPDWKGKAVCTVCPGLGLWAMFAASRGGDCSAIFETDPAGENSELNGCADGFLLNLESDSMADYDFSLYIGFPDQILPNMPKCPDVVILDTTFESLHVNTVDALGKLGVSDVLLIGEDPATAARDVARLTAAGYEFTRALPFDTFPQTAAFGCVYFLRHTGQSD